MTSTTAKCMQHLGSLVSEALGADYKFYRSKLEFRQAAGEGDNVIVLSSASKYSPNISVSFYFGRNFHDAKRIEKLLGTQPFHYHIQQLSINRSKMNGLGYSGPGSWEIDIREPIHPKLVSEIITAIQGMALPFFRRFVTIQSAREAIASDDPWCFGGKTFWRQLLFLDAALSDLQHFKEWSVGLDDFQKKQASTEIAEIENALSNAA